MTIRAYTTAGQLIVGSTITWTWVGLLNGDTGTPAPVRDGLQQWLAVLNSGTLGASGNLRWEGSIDGGTTWATLTDDQTNALNMTAIPTAKVMREKPLLVRPNVTSGDGTTSLTAILVTRR
jgi:hypothetical protein